MISFFIIEFESDHTIRGQYGDQHFVLLVISYNLYPTLSINSFFFQVQGITLIGIPVTITGIWALVRHYTIL